MDHRLIEGLMEAIAPLIKTYVDERIAKEVTPLQVRIKEYEARVPEKGEPGQDADPAIVASAVAAEVARALPEAVAAIPVPENGKDADPELVAAMVAAAVAKIPPALPGKDVDPADVEVMVELTVERAMAALTPAADGKDADPAVVAAMVAAEVGKLAPPAAGKDADPAQVAELVSAEVTKALEAWPRPADGKSVTVDDVMPLVLEEVAKAVSSEVAKIVPPNGKDGSSVTLEDVTPILQGMVDALPKAVNGKDADPVEIATLIIEDVAKLVPIGKDGKSVEIEDLQATITEQVDKKFSTLPKLPTSALVDGEGDLVFVYPDGDSKAVGKVRGEDGDRGASLMDGLVNEDGSLVLRMSDGRVLQTGVVRGKDGEPGKAGEPGRPGRDALEIKILPGIDENRSYGEGVCARWRGGVIRSERQTDPISDGDILSAGWGVLLDGIAEEIERDVDDGRVIERTTTYTSGKSFTRQIKTAMPLDRGVWKDGAQYEKGDGVTFGGSFFIAQRDTSDKPETSDAFRLAVKRGRNGADGKLITPRTGPVRLDGGR